MGPKMLTEECQNRRNNQIPSAEIRVDAALLGGLPVDSRVQYITERRSESCCVCGRGQGVGVKGDRALSQNSPQSSIIDTCHIFVSFISKTRGSRSRRVCLRRARHSHLWPDGARRRHVSVFNALSRPLQPSECGQAVLSGRKVEQPD